MLRDERLSYWGLAARNVDCVFFFVLLSVGRIRAFPTRVKLEKTIVLGMIPSACTTARRSLLHFSRVVGCLHSRQGYHEGPRQNESCFIKMKLILTWSLSPCW